MKFALPSAALTLIGGGLALYFGIQPGPVESTAPPLPDYSWSEMRSMYQEHRRLDDEVDGARRFDATLRRLLAEVRANSRSLADTADRLADAARQDNPSFLRIVERQSPGRTPRQLMLKVLLNHLTTEYNSRRITRAEYERLLGESLAALR